MIFDKPTASFRAKFFALVQEAKTIVITAHKSPDDDAIGSVLGLYAILKKKYPSKNLRMMITGPSVERFGVFENFEKIEFVEEIAECVGEMDLLIVLDGSQFYRFSNNPEKLMTVKKSICIDHHASPIDKFDLTLIGKAYPACAEIVYRCFGKEIELTQKMAEVFLLGILGDTGNFTYIKPNQTDTLLVAKKLMDIAQVEIQEFFSRYRSMSKSGFAIIRELMKNTKYVSINSDWPEMQYSFLTKEFVKENNFSEQETSEGSHIYMSSYLRTIKGYPWGLVFKPEEDGGWGVSSRSLPKTVSVRDLMERMGLGGGHDRAAGGKIKEDFETPEECVKLMVEWMNKNKPLVV